MKHPLVIKRQVGALQFLMRGLLCQRCSCASWREPVALPARREPAATCRTKPFCPPIPYCLMSSMLSAGRSEPTRADQLGAPGSLCAAQPGPRRTHDGKGWVAGGRRSLMVRSRSILVGVLHDSGSGVRLAGLVSGAAGWRLVRSACLLQAAEHIPASCWCPEPITPSHLAPALPLQDGKSSAHGGAPGLQPLGEDEASGCLRLFA